MSDEPRPRRAFDRSSAGFAIRPGGRTDLGFVHTMLYEAAFWRVGAPRPAVPAQASDDPELAVYLDGWGRYGDRALIACTAEQPLGAAWFRLFTEQAHGYGFVDRDTPELGLAVAAPHRGHGIGTALVAAALTQATLDGFGRLSLSVEPDNPALRLYERLGFRRVGAHLGSVTMVVTIGRAGRRSQSS